MTAVQAGGTARMRAHGVGSGRAGGRGGVALLDRGGAEHEGAVSVWG